MSRIRPVNGRIIVRPVNETETEGGIFLPESVMDKKVEKPEVGIVVVIDKTQEHSLNEQLAPGTKVLFNRYAALEVERASEGNRKYFVMMKDNVLGIYEDGDYEELCPSSE